MNFNYLQDANYMVKSILKEKIQELSQQKRENITIYVANRIRTKYLELKDWYGDALKPREIYEQACNQVSSEIAQKLKPPASANYRTLSEQLENDQADT